MRDTEVQGLAGTSYLLMGVWLVYLTFPSDIVHQSLWVLAIADPVASLTGKLYGRHKAPFGKSWEGFMGACFSAFGVAIALKHSLPLAIAMGVLGGVSELVEILGIDDNFTFPILNSIALYVLIYLIV